MDSKTLLGLSLGALLLSAAPWQSRAPQAPSPLAPPGSEPQATRSIARLPFLIDSPGRYVLAGTLVAAARPPKGAESGIVIQADHVELDLGGHALVGAEGTGAGIRVILPEERTVLYDVSVRNGALTGWGGCGVDLAFVQGARLIELRATGNGSPRTTAFGLRAGEAGLVRDCLSLANTGAGILAGEGSLLEDCLADRNGQSGFELGPQASARACSATRNGLAGFTLGAGASLVDCSTGANTGDGVLALVPASVRGCTAAGNGGSGVAAGRGSVVEGCLSVGNSRAGIAANGQCRLEGNHLLSNGASLMVSGGNAVVRNTIDDSSSALLLAAASPGGLFLPDDDGLLVSIAGVGSLRAKPRHAGPPSEEPQLVEDEGVPAPWANLVLK